MELHPIKTTPQIAALMLRPVEQNGKLISDLLEVVCDLMDGTEFLTDVRFLRLRGRFERLADYRTRMSAEALNEVWREIGRTKR